MLTQTMPALMKALQSAMSPGQVQSITQALGNCNQPLTHRGPVNISASNYASRGGEYPGSTYIGDTWNTHNYGGPVYNENTYLGDTNFIEFGDLNNFFNEQNQFYNLYQEYNAGDNITNIAGDTNNTINNNINNSQFSFPTNNFFTNNFDNSVTTTINDNSYFNNVVTNNSYTNNQTTNNINITNINGNPVAGPAGPPGQPGQNGRDGAPGSPGMIVNNFIPVPVIVPPNVAPPPKPVRRKVLTGGPLSVNLPTIDMETPTATVTLPTYGFDAENCRIVETGSKSYAIEFTDFTPPKYVEGGGGPRVGVNGYAPEIVGVFF